MRLLAGLIVIASLPPNVLHFDKQSLANDLAGGYQVITCDVNGDGRQDLLAVATGMPDLVWFENPTWERHVMATNLPHMINAACWSKHPHAPPIVAVAYNFSMRAKESLGNVAVLTSDGDPKKPWKMHEIDRLPTSHRLRWADIDGSKNKVLINAPLTGTDALGPDYRGHVPLVYYRPGEWKRREISDAEEGVVHGIYVTDWDGDGRESILIGSFGGIHLYQYGRNGNWMRTEITTGRPAPWPKSGTTDIAVGRLGRQRFLAAIEPWHGNEVAVYRSRGGVWQRELIDDTLLEAHTIQTVDIQGDGQDGIVVGFRGKPYGVYLYAWDGTKWNRQIIEQGEIAASGCTVAQLTPGKTSVACIGSATHNLVLYNISQTN